MRQPCPAHDLSQEGRRLCIPRAHISGTRRTARASSAEAEASGGWAGVLRTVCPSLDHILLCALGVWVDGAHGHPCARQGPQMHGWGLLLAAGGCALQAGGPGLGEDGALVPQVGEGCW